VLAARRHRVTCDPADLEWARRITDWLAATLVEEASGIVWDGIDPARGAGPNHERYSYNQGTVAAANHEVAALTGDPAYGERALRVAWAALPDGALPGGALPGGAAAADPAGVPAGGGGGLPDPGGVLPDEGGGDRALFKGIYARYAVGLGDARLTAALAGNGAAAWAARSPEGLIGRSWTAPPGPEVDLSAHLSGVLLLSGLAAAGAPTGDTADVTDRSGD
jgi:hypothetical protein